MTRICRWLALLAISFAQLVVVGHAEAVAQAAAPSAAPAGEAAEHDVLRALLARGTAAINDGKFEEIKAVLHPKFSITTINQEHLTTLAELDDFLKRWFTGDKPLVRSHKMVPTVNELTQIIDGRFAIARGTNVETYEMMRGVSFTFNSRWTASLVKEGGQWKLAAIHNGVDFTDNPVLRAAASSSMTVLLAGLAIGVAGTLLAGWLSRRRRAAV